MTEYTPKLGDRVRRTLANGTVIEGTFTLNTAVGTVYRHPTDPSQAVIRIDTGDDPFPWLGRVGKNTEEGHWYSDEEVAPAVELEEWIETRITL